MKRSGVFFYACIILATIVLAVNLQNRQIFLRGTWDYHFVDNFMVLPKILYCFVVLFFCQNLANSDRYKIFKKVVHFFAKYSFFIFFVHVFFICIMFPCIRKSLLSVKALFLGCNCS